MVSTSRKPVSLSGNQASHCSGAGTFVITSGPGELHLICVNQAATTVTVKDGTQTIGVIGTGTGAFQFDVAIVTGLSVVVVGPSADITVSAR